LDEARPPLRRLFAGIELDDGLREACVRASEALRRAGFAARFEAPEKLHVTVAFLGGVEAGRVDGVREALSTAARASARFALRFDRLGAFPHERRPRIVYVGARDQGAPFRSLCANVRAGLERLGFAFDADAVAHVTIARVKAPAHPLPLVEVPPVALDVERIGLFESLFDPARNTSRYETIATATLAAAR
jgi:2'-5' RNA ligase